MNMTFVCSISHSIIRKVNIKLEVFHLSCLESSSKQLNHVAYIGRTSANTKFSLDLEYSWRIKEMKFCEIHLLWAAPELCSWCNSLCFRFLLLAESQWSGKGNGPLEFLFKNLTWKKTRFLNKSSKNSMVWGYGNGWQWLAKLGKCHPSFFSKWSLIYRPSNWYVRLSNIE